MTIIYLTEYNTRCYGVTFQNNGLVGVQKQENISDDKDIMIEKQSQSYGNSFR